VTPNFLGMKATALESDSVKEHLFAALSCRWPGTTPGPQPAALEARFR
jgi:hypothetical protein